jgi:hypothetical protein
MYNDTEVLMGNAVRRTISIPANLDRQMELVSETEAVNWSLVAATAFEIKLAEIASRKEKPNMEDVVKRIKASLLTEKDKVYQEGFSLGQAWAMKSADWPQMKRLAEVRKRPTFETEFANIDRGGPSFLVMTAYPDKGGIMIQDAWHDWVGEDWVDKDRNVKWDLARGFWDGVLFVHNSVADKL